MGRLCNDRCGAAGDGGGRMRQVVQAVGTVSRHRC